MYARILLAYDGTTEGRAALREGALLARRCGAKVFLLSVIAETAGGRVAEGVQAGALAKQYETYQAILAEGVARLVALGLDPVAELVAGEPAQAIGAFARRVGADLVVVAHRKQSLFERWWSGSAGAYLIDHVACTLLIARNTVSDEMLVEEMRRNPSPVAPPPV